MKRIGQALAVLSTSTCLSSQQTAIAQDRADLENIIVNLASLEPQSCPPHMAEIESTYCIDKWEAMIIDKKTGNAASPHYIADPEQAQRQFERFRQLKIDLGGVEKQLAKIKLYRLQQNTPLSPQEIEEMQLVMITMPARGAEQFPSFEPMAVSLPHQTPASHVSRTIAEQACTNAGKRLCTADEWYKACIGSQNFAPYFDKKGEKVFPDAYPYGPAYEKDKCNIGLLKDGMWPPGILGRVNNWQMMDPRISRLIGLDAQPMISLTGSFPDCVSSHGVYDLVGNMHEIVEDIHILPDWNKRRLVEDPGTIPPSRKRATYMGAHFARDARESCGQLTEAHWLGYTDYSIGFRCCWPPEEEQGEKASLYYFRPLPRSASSNNFFSVFATTCRISSTASGFALIESTP